MKVVLKEKYKNDLFIQLLNEELSGVYGANTWHKFNPWYYLQEEVCYFNSHEGLHQLPHWERPIKEQELSNNFYWYKNGEFHFKLSGEPTSDEACDAIAVTKWIEATQGKYINSNVSKDYDLQTVKQYLNDVMQENGYDLKELWKL